MRLMSLNQSPVQLFGYSAAGTHSSPGMTSGGSALPSGYSSEPFAAAPALTGHIVTGVRSDLTPLIARSPLTPCWRSDPAPARYLLLATIFASRASCSAHARLPQTPNQRDTANRLNPPLGW